jgi:hypothetical protein
MGNVRKRPYLDIRIQFSTETAEDMHGIQQLWQGSIYVAQE